MAANSNHNQGIQLAGVFECRNKCHKAEHSCQLFQWNYSSKTCHLINSGSLEIMDDCNSLLGASDCDNAAVLWMKKYTPSTQTSTTAAFTNSTGPDSSFKPTATESSTDITRSESR